MGVTSQWSCVRWIGPVGPVTHADVRDDVGIGTGAFRELEPGFCVPRWVTLFTGSMFIGWLRAVRGWRNWLLEDPLMNSWEWWRLDVVPPAPCLQVEGAFSWRVWCIGGSGGFSGEVYDFVAVCFEVSVLPVSDNLLADVVRCMQECYGWKPWWVGLEGDQRPSFKMQFRVAELVQRSTFCARLPVLPALYLPKKTWRLASQTDPLEHLEESPGSR